MKTVNEVSKQTGVSVRALHYYDTIGLLRPAAVTESGYRLYDDTALERLQDILLFRELEFPLKEIRRILDSPGFDRKKALEQQITLLELKREHIENVLALAREIKVNGGKQRMNFEAFDSKKLDEYAKQAKEYWGKTAAYQEFEQKNAARSEEETQSAGETLMKFFTEFGALKSRNLNPADDEVQKQVAALQAYITEHFYHCTEEILQSLGAMYGGGGEMTENIDRAGGAGCGVFVNRAIEEYCRR